MPRWMLLADQSLSHVITVAAIFAVIIVGVVAFAVFARYFRLWIQSFSTGARTACPFSLPLSSG